MDLINRAMGHMLLPGTETSVIKKVQTETEELTLEVTPVISMIPSDATAGQIDLSYSPTAVLTRSSAPTNITTLMIPMKPQLAESYECESKNTKRKSFSRLEIELAVHQANQLEDTVDFQAFNPHHKDVIDKLITVLFSVKLEDMEAILAYAELQVNPTVMTYITSTVLRHRPDVLLQKALIPSQITVAPHLYFDLGGLQFEKRTNADGNQEFVCKTKFEYDEKQRDIESRLDYFYNDPGLNSHHRHWHEAYPDTGITAEKRKLDRLGELFYYMHSQMVVRLNAERLSVDAEFLKPFPNFREPIAEPYFNKLELKSRMKKWDSRPANTTLSDLKTAGVVCRIQDIELWRDRIYDAIDRGFVYAKDKQGNETLERLNSLQTEDEKQKGIPVDTGVDVLGAMLLASRPNSKNYPYYGNVHNMGHMLIGYSHDPNGFFYKQSYGGAMTMAETACRDPAFWRWHQFIDDVFDRYKRTLPEYTIAELDFAEVEIEKVILKDCTGQETSTLNTTFAADEVDITAGVSADKKKMLGNGRLFYSFVHLTHDPFTYEFTVKNTGTTNKKGVVRTYFFPSYTDYDLKETLYRQGQSREEAEKERNPNLVPHFNKHRRMAMELDKFVVELKPGSQIVSRESKKSSVTAEMKQLFVTFAQASEFNNNPNKSNESWCGCGWPDYLLLPKGTAEGLPGRIFVMISDYEKDKVGNENVLEKGCLEGSTSCTRASVSFCGVRDYDYPDKKPMGYPFDRQIGDQNALLDDFLTKNRDPDATDKDQVYFKNMKLTGELKIKFTNNADTFAPPKAPKVNNFRR